MLTVSLLVCAMMALATADDNPTDHSKLEVVHHPTPAPPPAPSCPDNFREHNGRCFRFFPRAMTWSEAEKNCQSMNANLASVHSTSEDQFLQSYIKEIALNNEDTWIGGSDCQQDNSWLWSDGKAFSFNFWCSGEPTAIGDCIVMNSGAGTCWSGRLCSSSHPSMCATTL